VSLGTSDVTWYRTPVGKPPAEGRMRERVSLSIFTSATSVTFTGSYAAGSQGPASAWI